MPDRTHQARALTPALKHERPPGSRPAGHQAAPAPWRLETSGRTDAPADGPASSVDSVLALQQAVGNRAVVEAIQRPALQRVEVTVKDTGETLYNQSGTGGKAAAKHYGGTPATFDMTRNGDAGVTATVKIKFLSQDRNPPAGTAVVDPVEIPAGDPRRSWASTTVGNAVAHWNGRLVLVGEEWNAFSKNTKKRLPVTFQAVPVFAADEEAHAQVVVHPMSVVAQGSANNNPIDAGNYYMNKDKDVYPASDDVIYAHEYGHLLGMPDEYSQSNQQLNLLLHQAAPKSAPSSMAALDRATVERMTLAALRRPLSDQLDAMLPDVTKALLAARPKVRTRMSSAAREGVRTAEVRDQLAAQLAAKSEAKVSKSIPAVVAFETTSNYSNKDLAKEGVAAGFNAAGLTSMISDAYWKALEAPQATTVAIKDYGDVRINIKDSARNAAGSGTTLAGSAAGVGSSVVGTPAAAGLPAVMPSASLSGQLSAIPATWAAAGSALETAITPAAFAGRVAALLEAAGMAQTLYEMLPGVTPAPKIGRTKGLYQRAYSMLTTASREAAQQLAADLLNSSIMPILTSSVTTLQSTIATEVARIMTTPPAGLAAAPLPDPHMAAMVAGMKSRLDADKAATADTKLDPLAKRGSTVAEQDVTYSYQGLMGSNKNVELRADQFQSIVNLFNKKLKGIFESSFTAEVK